MPFDPGFPPHGVGLVSADWRTQFNSLKALIDAVALQLHPIGSVFGYAKNLASLPALPGTWAECNGQVLNDSESPLDGATLPDLNVTQRFIRGSVSSGGTGGGETHSHTYNSSVTAAAGSDVSAAENGTGTTDANHLPPFYELVFVIRVK